MSIRHEVGDKNPRNARETRLAIDRLLLLAQETIDSNPEDAILLAEQAATACQIHPFGKKYYQKGLAHSFHVRAAAYLNQGEFGQALKFHSNSLSIYRDIKDQRMMAVQLNSIGMVYAYCGDYAEALKYMRAAEACLNKNAPLYFKAEILNNIGYTYVVLGNYANAIPILLTSLETTKKAKQAALPNHLIVQANIYDSLCQAYLAQHNLSAALLAGIKSTALCHQTGNLKKEAEYVLILGEVYNQMENHAQAYVCYQQTLTLARAHGFRREEAEAYRRMGIHQSLQGNYSQAIQLLEDALVIAEEIKIQREVYECHYALSMFYKATGEFEKALDQYESFHQIKETVFNEQSDQRIKNLEMLHQMEQARRESEINQQKTIELQKEIAERKKAQKLTEILASTDSLTGINNRRHFFILAERCIAEAIHTKVPVGVIILDVDHFKTVNDHYGHQEGDQVLAAIAQKISLMLRKGDIVGRYGGEEFVIALPQTEIDLCLMVAERLRTAVENLDISRTHQDLKVTISLGIACLEAGAPPEADLVLEKLIDHADQAMYAAKNQGRNRVVAYLP